MKHIYVAKLMPDAPLPTRNNEHDAGLDLRSYYDVMLKAGDIHVVKTGVSILIPIGYMGLVMPKSRNDYLIGAGIIDAGYIGEIKVKVVNVTNRTIGIAYDEAFAQMIVVPIETPPLKEVDESQLVRMGKAMSPRGDGGGINQ